MFDYDKLSEQLWELSKVFPKELEAKLMELSAIINRLKELENA
jgi:hypothetical protein